MENKKQKNKKVVFGALIILLSVVVLVVYVNRYFTDLGTFLFSFSLSFIGVLLGLYFSGERSFNAWKKFAIIYLPVAFLLVLIIPKTGGFVSPDSELASLWLAGIFFVVSVGIIWWKREKHSPLDLHEC